MPVSLLSKPKDSSATTLILFLFTTSEKLLALLTSFTFVEELAPGVFSAVVLSNILDENVTDGVTLALETRAGSDGIEASSEDDSCKFNC